MLSSASVAEQVAAQVSVLCRTVKVSDLSADLSADVLAVGAGEGMSPFLSRKRHVYKGSTIYNFVEVLVHTVIHLCSSRVMHA